MLVIALLIDGAIGDPEPLWRRVAHPVALAGALIAALDRFLNRPDLAPAQRRTFGVVTVVILVIVAVVVGAALEILFARLRFGWIGTTVVAATLIAGRGLYDHVAAVATAFGTGLAEAQQAVARIVGRDPTSLDEAGVCRAAIESAAENFSDGVVAPALWFALLGLPGMLVYKAINTADSMIGHMTPRHRDFGWAAARLDDLLNLPASRLSGALIALAAPLAGGSIMKAWTAMATNARRHRSPNAGWPEAAMAGALGLALAGPRRYPGVLVDDPFLNANGRREATPDDIRRALRVYAGACVLLLIMAAAVAAPVLIASSPRW